MTPEERAEYERRMRLPPINVRDLPVPIPDTGNPVAVPDPVMEVGEPTITRRVPQPRPEVPIEDPSLAKLVANLGGVADRAQLGMHDPRVAVEVGDLREISRVEEPSGPRPGGIPAQVAQFVMGAAGRKPLVSSGGDSGQVSPPVDKPAAPSEEDKLAKALEFARKRQGLGNVGAALTEQLAIANGRDASGTVNRMRADAAAPVTDAQKKLEAAKKFVLEKQKRDQAFAKDMTAQERADRLEKRGVEQQQFERGRQGERDALNKRLVESQIAENEAQAAKAARRGGVGGVKPKPPAQIPAEAAGNLGELEAGGREVDALEKDWNELASAWHSGLTQFVPGTDAKQFDDARLAGAQRIGSIIEGGKLTDSDLRDKYLPLMPSASDSKDRAQAKLLRLRRMIEESRDAKVKGLTQAGFNTSGIERPTRVPGPKSLDEPTSAKQAPFPNGKRIRDPKTGRTGWWDGVSPLPPGAEVING
jgi:hypothetical protein